MSNSTHNEPAARRKPKEGHRNEKGGHRNLYRDFVDEEMVLEDEDQEESDDE